LARLGDGFELDETALGRRTEKIPGGCRNRQVFSFGDLFEHVPRAVRDA